AGCGFFFFQAEDGIRDWSVTGVQTCALPVSPLLASVMKAGDDLFDFYVACSLIASENQTQAHLDAASGTRARNHTEARPAESRSRQSEIGMVECVEHLQPELEAFLFGEEEILEQREVEVDHAVAANHSAPARAERKRSGLREGRRVEPAAQRAFGRSQIGIAQHIGVLRSGGKGVGRVRLGSDG